MFAVVDPRNSLLYVFLSKKINSGAPCLKICTHYCLFTAIQVENCGVFQGLLGTVPVVTEGLIQLQVQSRKVILLIPAPR